MVTLGPEVNVAMLYPDPRSVRGRKYVVLLSVTDQSSLRISAPATGAGINSGAPAALVMGVTQERPRMPGREWAVAGRERAVGGGG